VGAAVRLQIKEYVTPSKKRLNRLVLPCHRVFVDLLLGLPLGVQGGGEFVLVPLVQEVHSGCSKAGGTADEYFHALSSSHFLKQKSLLGEQNSPKCDV